MSLPTPLLAAALALAALPAAPQAADWNGLALPPSLQRLLETGKWDATPASFRIVALSFTADGCVAQARRDPGRAGAARACVLRCLALADATRRRFPDTASADGLWLTHYNLLLGAADELGACPDPDRHEQTSRALARRSLIDRTGHVASYAALPFRWPADQTAMLASLARYDRAHGAHLLGAPLRKWRGYVLQYAMDPALELPWSEATGIAPGAKAPRGCALSWQTRYLKEVDEPLAREWWSRYRKHYLVQQGILSGFREWPRGRDRPADFDSGPIVLGVGAAASGLGIAAARSMGDEALAARLETTARIVERLLGGEPSLKRAARTIIADAIRFVGATAR